MDSKYLLFAVFLFTLGTKITGETLSRRYVRSVSVENIKGRLLSPQEGCGLSEVRNTKIVGGQNAKIGAWPWMVLLGYNMSKGIEFQCGGSLITSRHVLTAAHCVLPELVFARLAEHDISTEEDGPHLDVKVVRAVPHENYNRRQGIKDIGMIYLEHDVDFTNRIRPICLPLYEPMKSHSFVNTTPFVTGWGYLDEGAGKPSNILQQVQVPIHETKVCPEQYEKEHVLVVMFKNFTDDVLCAGDLSGGKDSCKMDSGSPLMLPVFEEGHFPFYQIGIVSYGIGCARARLPSVYANITNFADWITQRLLE